MKNEQVLFPGADEQSGVARSQWMVVDDNADILNVLALFLGDAAEASVHCFASARAALTAFQTAPAAWSAVITDLEMPAMDGIELCNRLRAIRPGLKIFLATGSCLITEAEAAQLGFCALLHKPFQFSTLLRMLLAAGVENHHPVAGATGPALVCVAA
jgi:CheY-like chemotaxis protein